MFNFFKKIRDRIRFEIYYRKKLKKSKETTDPYIYK